MPRLNKTFINAIPLPVKKADGAHAQAFYRDDALPGFGLRVSGGGTKTFIVEKRIDGRVKRLSLGRYGELTPEQARREAAKVLGEIASGADPVKAKRERRAKRVTLREAFEDYLAARKDLKPLTVRDYRKCIEHSLADWCEKPLKDISKDAVQGKHSELGAKSPARANNTMRVLRAVFNFASDQYETAGGESYFPINPVDRLSKAKAWYRIERRQSLIKPHELKGWYAATQNLPNDATRDYLVFLLFTGLRKNEGARLAWADVDLKDKSFQIPDTKNRELHRLPLSDFLFDMLERRYQQREPQSLWVFPSDITQSHLVEPRRGIERVRLLSGVEFSLHDLRRTFITTAESLDIPAYALKRLLNHRLAEDVTAGYIVPNVERLRKPMQKITNFLQGKMKS